jgi:hypothetical protein
MSGACDVRERLSRRPASRVGFLQPGGPTAVASQPIPSPAVPTDGNLPSSEFGLALGYVIGHHFLNMQDLHYGYWPEGLAPLPQNLAQAQANYTDFLMSHIPAGVRAERGIPRASCSIAGFGSIAYHPTAC